MQVADGASRWRVLDSMRQVLSFRSRIVLQIDEARGLAPEIPPNRWQVHLGNSGMNEGDARQIVVDRASGNDIRNKDLAAVSFEHEEIRNFDSMHRDDIG
jgi:hypothetical protein